MAKKLAVLLGRPQDKLLHVALEDLEKSTGHHALDTRLLGDILRRAHKMIRQVGLKNDATARELYQTLRVHVDKLDASMQFVGVAIDGEVVSFHHGDIADDIAQKRQFATRSLARMQQALAREVAERYTAQSSHPQLLQKTIKYLAK